MFVPIFITLATPMILGVIWLANLYNLEFAWQSTQVVLDNAAIQLGQNDLKVVRALEKDQNKISALHKKYHQSLACSLVPVTAITCSRLAEVLRKLIRAANSVSSSMAQFEWSKGTTSALSEIKKANQNLLLHREKRLELKQKSCSLCREGMGWELTCLKQTKSTFLQDEDPHLSVSVSILNEEKGKWNYRLWAK